MTESKFETVSSLVDEYQLSEASLLEMSKDEQMSDTWKRYHLIGDAIRDEIATPIDMDLSTNIASAIAAEPTVLAPQRKTVGDKVKASVVKLAKPFGQVAIAASAATLMIVGVQQNVAQNEQAAPMQVVQTVPLLGAVEPVSYNVNQVEKISEQERQQAYLDQQQRFQALQALLADHQQQLKLKQVNRPAIEDQNTIK